MLVPFEKTNDERIKIYSTVRSASYTRSCSYQHCYLLHIADAKIRNVLSAAIVEFHEGDLLFKLKEKWWKTRNPPDAAALEKCHIYSNASSGSSNSEMGLSSVGGVFIVLFVGCLAGTIIGIGEFVWELQKIPYGERESILAEMFHACKLVVTCRGRKFSPVPQSLEVSSLGGDTTLRSATQSPTRS